MKLFPLLLLAFTSHCVAATTIEITAKFADVPAGTEIPSKPELLAKQKDIEIFSAPRVTVVPGKTAAIEVTQPLDSPDGTPIPLGIALSIKPSLTEKGNISFSGRATDRFKHGQNSGDTLTTVACVSRELYFKGYTTSGSTVILSGGAATSASSKKEGATVVRTRELMILLTFKKVSIEPEKADAKKVGDPVPQQHPVFEDETR